MIEWRRRRTIPDRVLLGLMTAGTFACAEFDAQEDVAQSETGEGASSLQGRRDAARDRCRGAGKGKWHRCDAGDAGGPADAGGFEDAGGSGDAGDREDAGGASDAGDAGGAGDLKGCIPQSSEFAGQGLSNLPCSRVIVGTPFPLRFTARTEGIPDNAEKPTGFSMILPAPRGQGYVPGSLSVRVPTRDGLAISAGAGSMDAERNAQDNALGVGLALPAHRLRVDGRLWQPPEGSGAYEEAGLWFGRSQSEYVKLVLQSTPNGPVVKAVLERHDAIQRSVEQPVVLPADYAQFALEIDPVAREVRALAVVGPNLLELIASFTGLPEDWFNWDAAGFDPELGTGSFAGILANRGERRPELDPLTYHFADFVVSDFDPDPELPVVSPFRQVRTYPFVQPWSRVSGDVNGDGAIDLVSMPDQLSPQDSPRLAAFLNDGSGGFPSSVFSALPLRLGNLVAADFNADDAGDLMGVEGECELRLVLGQGDGTFQVTDTRVRKVWEGPSSSCNAITGDFDGDGGADLALLYVTEDESRYYTLGQQVIDVFLGHGDGSFAHAAQYASQRYIAASSLADLNRDGAADLVLAEYEVDQNYGDRINVSLEALLADRSGGFRPGLFHRPFDGGNESDWAWAAVASGDLNGDLRTDLALLGGVGFSDSLGRVASRIFVLLGNGDGTFAREQTIEGNSPVYMVAFDADDDGQSDLLVDRGQWGFSLYTGRGDGTFQEPLAVSGDGVSIAGAFPIVGDYDGDGRSDVAFLGWGELAIALVGRN